MDELEIAEQWQREGRKLALATVIQPGVPHRVPPDRIW